MGIVPGLMGLFMCAKREPRGERLRVRMGYDLPDSVPLLNGSTTGFLHLTCSAQTDCCYKSGWPNMHECSNEEDVYYKRRHKSCHVARVAWHELHATHFQQTLGRP